MLDRIFSAPGSLRVATSAAGTIEPARSLARLARVEHPTFWLVARITALLTLAVALELWFMRLTRLPLASFAEPALVAELAGRLGSTRPLSALALLAGVLALGAALRSRSLGPDWSDFAHPARLRSFIVLIAAVLAWVYATYDYNYYFDQPHHLDRLLLLLIVPLVFWRPAFVIPFLLVLLPVIWQFAHPIRGFSWAAPILLIRVLFLFVALWLARTLTNRARTADFLFLVACLVAAHYWVSGWGKLQLGWIGSDQIGLLLPATYANGWLGFLDPETISRVTRALLALNMPMQVGTLLVECGALFALRSRTVLRAFIVACIALHLGIFLLTGIFFWMWMVLNAAMLLFFLSRGAPAPPIFSRPHFLLSLVLIGGGALWFRPVPLAWLDARASYTYRLEATTASGRVVPLPPRYFAPYDYQFTLGHFRYLTAEPHLPITWGAVAQRELARALAGARTAEQVMRLESERGLNAFDPQRSATFDHFVRQFIRRRSASDAPRTWWARVQPPPLLWTFPLRPAPRASEPLRRVTVHQVLSLFDDRRYLEIRKRPVRVIELRPNAPLTPP